MNHFPNVAIFGKAGAGKSTVASILHAKCGYSVIPLAGPLKDIAAELWGDPARTSRHLLQSLGVAVREIEEDTWIDLLLTSVRQEDRPVACDDVRFPNEYNALRRAGWRFVRVECDLDTRITRLRANGKLTDLEQLGHVSETALDGWPADHVIHNEADTPREELEDQLYTILHREVNR